MITAFLSNLESIFAWVLEASWQASVLVVLVLLLQVTLHGRLNPRWYHALWLLVILRLVLPTLPESALSFFQFTPHASPVITQSMTEPIFDTTPAPTTPQRIRELPASAYPFSIYTLLALTWLSGAFGLFVVTWLVNHRFAQHVRSAVVITDPRLLEIAAAAQGKLGVRRPLRLIESSQAKGPAIMGLFYPTLILPKDVRAKFTDEELRFIFLHEFAHLKRGDLVVQWIIALLQIVHWFNPVLWYAFRRMRADREPATDALVLSHEGETQKESYGQVLVKLLEHHHARHSLPTLIGILEDKDQFKRRFLLITTFTRGAYGWSLLGVLLLLGLAVGGLTRSTAEPAKLQSSNQAAENKWVCINLYAVDIAESTYQSRRVKIDEAAKDGNYQTIRRLPSARLIQALTVYLELDGSSFRIGTGPSPYMCTFELRSHPDVAPDKISLEGQVILSTSEMVMYGNTPVISNKAITGPAHPIRLTLTLQKTQSVEPLGIIEPIEPSDEKSKQFENSKELRRLYVFLTASPTSVKDVPVEFRHSSQATKVDAGTQLLMAVSAGDVEEIKLLLEQGVDPNAEGHWGPQHDLVERPIGWAVTNQSLGIAQLLLDHGANADDYVPYALNMGNSGMVKLFWDHGARSISELSYAISQGVAIDKIRALLDQGVPVNPPQDKVMTPLAVAAAFGNKEAVDLLLDRGADPNKCGVFPQETWARPEHSPPPDLLLPLTVAAGNGQDEIVEELLNRGVRPTHEAILKAVERSTVSSLPRSRDHFERSINLLIKSGALKDVSAEESGRLLFSSIYYGNCNPDTLKMLLAAGLNPHSECSDTKGKTLVDYVRDDYKRTGAASIKPALDILDDADKGSPTKTDADNSTLNAQMLAAVQKGDATALQKLIEQSTGPLTKDDQGNDVLDYLFDYSPQGQPIPLNALVAALKRSDDPNPKIHTSGRTSETYPLLDQAIVDVGLKNPAEAIPSYRTAVKMLLDHGASFANVTDPNVQTLLKAAALGDLATIKQTIAQGTSINSIDGNGYNALTISVAMRYDDLANWLIDQGADVNGYARNGTYSPLRFAVWHNKLDLVERLIARGAKVDASDVELKQAVDQNDQRLFDDMIKAGANPKHSVSIIEKSGGITWRLPESIPLFVCIKKGQSSMAVTLLEHGAEAEPAFPQDNRNLAYWAVYYDRPEVLQALLDHGANPLLKDDGGNPLVNDTSHGESALSLAQKSHPDLVPMLEKAIKPADANTSIDAGATLTIRTFLVPPNFFADNVQKTNVQKQLFDKGIFFPAGATASFVPDSSSFPKSGNLVVTNTPEQLDLIANLISQSSSPETKTEAGMLEAVEKGDLATLRKLVEQGRPFDPKIIGPPLLEDAAAFGRTDIVTYLLSRGVDPNDKASLKKDSSFFETPLTATALNGQYDTAKILLEHGARITRGDEIDALYNRRTEITRLFWEHGARSISELTYEISQVAPVADIQKLLDAGMSADPPQDQHTMRPLTLASELDRLDIVTLLVEHGANVNQSSPGTSATVPVDAAARQGEDEIVAYLVQHGAKIDYQSLWDVAWNAHPGEEQRSKEHFENTLKILVDSGALKSLTPEQKGRILDAVINTRYAGGNATALKMLLDAGLSPELPLTDRTSGAKIGMVISTYRDWRAKNPDDPFKIFPLIDMLETADKEPASKADTGVQAPAPNPGMLFAAVAAEP